MTEFEFENRKHQEFFLPYYEKENFEILEDNIGKGYYKYDVKTIDGTLWEEKARKSDFGDCCIELLQDVKTANLGWYYSQAHIVLYASWQKEDDLYPASFYKIHLPKLKEYILNLNKIVETVISKKGWGVTWNIIIAWDDLVKNEIAKKIDCQNNLNKVCQQPAMFNVCNYK